MLERHFRKLTPDAMIRERDRLLNAVNNAYNTVTAEQMFAFKSSLWFLSDPMQAEMLDPSDWLMQCQEPVCDDPLQAELLDPVRDDENMATPVTVEIVVPYIKHPIEDGLTIDTALVID